MKGDGEFIPVNALKPYGGLDVWRQSLFTLSLDGGQQSTYSPGQFTSQEKDSPAPTEEQVRWVTEEGWDILELSHNSLVIQPAAWSLSDYVAPATCPVTRQMNPDWLCHCTEDLYLWHILQGASVPWSQQFVIGVLVFIFLHLIRITLFTVAAVKNVCGI